MTDFCCGKHYLEADFALFQLLIHLGKSQNYPVLHNFILDHIIFIVKKSMLIYNGHLLVYSLLL